MRELGEITRLEVQLVQEKPRGIAEPMELASRYERLHLSAKAVGWRFRVLQFAPQHQPTHLALAEFFEGSGQPHRAARHRVLAGE